MPSRIGSEIPVNTSTRNAQYVTGVRALPNGGFLVVWDDAGANADHEMVPDTTGAAASGYEVRGQMFAAGGGRVGPEFLVNTTVAGHQYESRVATLPNGGFVVAWTDAGTSTLTAPNATVRLQLFAADGSRAGSEVTVNTVPTLGFQTFPDVAALADGRFVVTWSKEPAVVPQGGFSGADVHGQLFAADGSRIGSEFTANTTTQGAQSPSRVTALSNGGFVVTWTDGVGTDTDVRGQVFAADGSRIGAEFLANTTTRGQQAAARVVPLANGGFVVAWIDSGDPSGWTARAQLFAADGSRRGAEFLVNTVAPGDQRLGPVLALPDGGFVLSWTHEPHSWEGADGRQPLHAQAYAADGGRSGAEFLLDPGAATGRRLPPTDMALLANGSLVLAFSEIGGPAGDPSDWGVAAQVFSSPTAGESFDPYAYAALNPDLFAAFGTDVTALTRHYINNGRNEGRSAAGFDPDAYAALNPDLFAAFGTDATALTRHYISQGRAEGRAATGFDACAYLALNPDLLAAFGGNTAAATQHYISYGYAEGRAATGFDPYAYAALNPDLLAAFGTDADALARHYASHGRAEGRTATGFDPYAYAALNPDLFAAFGDDADALTRHYAGSGRTEGRSASDAGFHPAAGVLAAIGA